MVQRILVVLFFVSCLVALSTAAFNYCTLCKDHIACNNNGQFAKSCKNPKMLKFSSQNIQTALRAHDEVRNKIAGGSEKRFQPATKMPVLVSILNNPVIFINFHILIEMGQRTRLSCRTKC